MKTDRKYNLIPLAFFFILLLPMHAAAQVTPAIQLAGRGVMSFNTYDRAGGFGADGNSVVSDFSDTGILLGVRQKLYNDYRSRFVVGFQFPDADSDLGQVFFHQVHFQLENKWSVFRIGRTRIRSSLIEFPTLRDDDAIKLTDVLNPFSSGKNTEESQYGNVVEAGVIYRQRVHLFVHGEHFTVTPVSAEDSEEDFSLNSFGGTLEYRVPEVQRFNRNIVTQLGLGWNNFLTHREGYTGFDETLKNVLFSAVLNLIPDPVYFLDLRHQTIYNFGFDEVSAVNTYADLSRAKSVNNFTALRFLYRKLERPTAQLSLGVGSKIFPDLTNSTREISVIVNGFYRLGENLDIGLQYQFMNYKGDLLDLYPETDQSIKLALVFSFEQFWNEYYDERNSLLNLEHGYLP
ncbi:MAG: hypothetical protein GXO91_06985 [FCB group bacterium]|nr:hypothetical protein [FCB group bacterium]